MTTQPRYTSEVAAPDAIVDCLVEAGVRFVFGLSGGHTGRIFGALEKRQDDIRTILVREESLGAVMAETIGRMTGVPGVLLGQGPWVLGNGLLGTIEAHLAASPMLLLTDFSDTPGMSAHAPYQSGTGGYGNWDARGAFRAVTKEVFTAEDPNSAVICTQLALKHSMLGEPGPVAMIYGIDALTGDVAPDVRPRVYPTEAHVVKLLPDTPDLDTVRDQLAQSERPLILAGNGVRVGGGEAALATFVDATGIPVVTSPAGKGVFDDEHPLSRGVYGAYGNPTANRTIARADTIMALGTKLSASDTCGADPELIDPERQRIIQVDIEPRNLSWTMPVDMAILGDIRSVLGSLNQDWQAEPRQDWSAESNVPRMAPLPVSSIDASSIYPHEIIATMQEVLPPNTIYTCDAGENRIFMLHCLRPKGAGRFIQPAGAGPMGYAVPSALARKLLTPEATVVAFSGDGGFSMTMNGLLTAVEADLPILAIVMNNDALGWSQHSRNAFATQFARTDYSAIARGMGCGGFKPSTVVELESALAEALHFIREVGRPAVVNVETSMDVSFARLNYKETRALWANSQIQ